MNPAARREGDTLILCYHAISDRWPAALAITLAQLREQLEWLLARGYRGVTFSEAVTSQRSWPAVAITFDDAFSSVLDQAFPVMVSLGLPGTVFVVTDFGDSGRPLEWPGIDHWAAGEHRAELRGMTWPQLRSLEQVGWEVGSHSLTHPHLTKLGDDALAHELRESRAACVGALGHPVGGGGGSGGRLRLVMTRKVIGVLPLLTEDSHECDSDIRSSRAALARGPAYV